MSSQFNRYHFYHRGIYRLNRRDWNHRNRRRLLITVIISQARLFAGGKYHVLVQDVELPALKIGYQLPVLFVSQVKACCQFIRANIAVKIMDGSDIASCDRKEVMAKAQASMYCM